MEIKEKIIKNVSYISDEDAVKIHQMLFGPYHHSWRDVNGIVDNRDSVIAKRLKLKTSSVSNYTTILTRNHFKKIQDEKDNRER